MERAFWRAALDVRSLDLHDLREDAPLEAFGKRVAESLQAWETELRKVEPAVRTAFAGDHARELRTLREVLGRPLGRRALAAVPSLRGVYDRVLGRQGLLPPDAARPPAEVTRLFDAFLRGITYFEHDGPVGTPIYHRLSSCGPSRGGTAFRQEYLQCHEGMDPARRDEVIRRILACYVERLVYDALWRKQALFFPATLDDQTSDGTAQEEEHLHWLCEIREDFQSCFPRTDVQIELSYDALDRMPMELRVVGRVDGHVRWIETYRRQKDPERPDAYDPVVYAERVEDAGPQRARLQSFFAHDLPWMPKTSALPQAGGGRRRRRSVRRGKRSKK